ncbi:hypothetical protein OC835_007940, partial [Tilletia horrida]
KSAPWVRCASSRSSAVSQPPGSAASSTKKLCKTTQARIQAAARASPPSSRDGEAAQRLPPKLEHAKGVLYRHAPGRSVTIEGNL